MSIFGLVTKGEHAKLLRELEAIKASLPDYPEWALATADNAKYTIPDPSNYDNQLKLYRILSWVLLAVDLTASAGSLTPFNVKKLMPNQEAKDIPNHLFELLLQHPNESESRYEFLYSTIAFWKLTGNTYWWMNKASETSPPDELWVIPSNQIKPVPDGKLFIRGYLYYPGDGRTLFLDPWQIVHFKRFNPFNRFIGLSAIEAIYLVAQGDIGMQDWNTRLFKDNNARLPGIITFEQMVADPSWKKIKEDTRDAAKNRDLLMLRGVGQGGVNWIQNAVSQKDMEFLQGREANEREIMTTLAPGSYSMLSENATQANSVVGRASFNELTVYPMHIMISEKVTNNILPVYGENLVGEFEDIRVTDKDLKLREQDAFGRTHTLAEVRREYYGDEPLGDERDDLLIAQISGSTGKPEPEPAPQWQPLAKPSMNSTIELQEDTMPDDEEANKKISDELAKWERHVKTGHKRPPVLKYIPSALAVKIEAGLRSGAKVDAVFADAAKDLPLIALARAIEGMNG